MVTILATTESHRAENTRIQHAIAKSYQTIVDYVVGKEEALSTGTVFDSYHVQTEPISKWFLRIVNYFECNDECAVRSYYYVMKILNDHPEESQLDGFYLHSFTIYRFIVMSMHFAKCYPSGTRVIHHVAKCNVLTLIVPSNLVLSK